MTKLFLALVDWIKTKVLRIYVRPQPRPRTIIFEPCEPEPLDRR
jgi:hypothetical protein